MINANMKLWTTDINAVYIVQAAKQVNKTTANIYVLLIYYTLYFYIFVCRPPSTITLAVRPPITIEPVVMVKLI